MCESYLGPYAYMHACSYNRLLYRLVVHVYRENSR